MFGVNTRKWRLDVKRLRSSGFSSHSDVKITTSTQQAAQWRGGGAGETEQKRKWTPQMKMTSHHVLLGDNVVFRHTPS